MGGRGREREGVGVGVGVGERGRKRGRGRWVGWIVLNALNRRNVQDAGLSKGMRRHALKAWLLARRAILRPWMENCTWHGVNAMQSHLAFASAMF